MTNWSLVVVNYKFSIGEEELVLQETVRDVSEMFYYLLENF
jgi:hypothetical protein